MTSATVCCEWCKEQVPVALMAEHRSQELVDAALVLTEIPAGLQPAGITPDSWENDR
ncbi:MAG TPA: hypothetical protein VJN95_08875 [Gemmatimonadales bacterium]|nr:hypothetical protein [Gemmatimonadales bacterium]